MKPWPRPSSWKLEIRVKEMGNYLSQKVREIVKLRAQRLIVINHCINTMALFDAIVNIFINEFTTN